MKTIFGLLFVLITFTSVAQEDKKDYSEAIKLIEVWLDAQKDYEKIPGLTIAVIDDQEVLWSGAVGMSNSETGLASTTSTLGSICSISKLFTSVAIMKLYDEGKLRLDDRVEDILPWYNLEQQYEDSGPITIRSLLTHSSGLPREANAPYWTGPDFPFPSQQEIKDGLSEQETLYPASTYFQYSNLGLTLLGEIVEEMSGIPYDEYVTTNILEPLGLVSTRPYMPVELYGQELSVGYSSLTREGKRDKVKLFNANGITAAAGYSSNVEDLGKFASWQFRLRDSTIAEILKPSTLKNMHNVHWLNPDWGTSWGLGFSVYKGSDGNKWVSHGGSCPGYRSTLQLNLNTKMAYVAMINSSGTNPGKYTSGIRAILEKMKGKKKTDDESTEEEMVDFSDFTGYYSGQPWSSESYISTWEGQLVRLGLPTSNPGNSMTMYKHVEGDVFRRIRKNKELGEALIFYRDENGKVSKLSSHGNFSVKMVK